eukprot:scaffold67_cov338-Prasinococcus_capsulatus_cf.AAC.3
MKIEIRVRASSSGMRTRWRASSVAATQASTAAAAQGLPVRLMRLSTTPTTGRPTSPCRKRRSCPTWADAAVLLSAAANEVLGHLA